MALITETNAQYYEGEQYFNSTGQVTLNVTLTTDLNDYGAEHHLKTLITQ